MTVNKIGRTDSTDKIRTTNTTVSGTPEAIATFGRRNYIKVRNEGTVDIAVGNDTLAVSGTNGFVVAANGGEWDDNTDAPVYIVSTGADSEVRIYERATR